MTTTTDSTPILSRFQAMIAAKAVAGSHCFKQGQKFRVIKDGARLEGLIIFGKTNWSGWSRRLTVGEVLVCNGEENGWDSSTVKLITFNGARVPENARYVTVWPMAGLWSPWPMAGYLELID
jgi:hypothetical protein